MGAAWAAKFNLRPNSRRNRSTLVIACTPTVATDKYQTSRMVNPGRSESSVAGSAKMSSRVAELASGGQVLPSPWNVAELVKMSP